MKYPVVTPHTQNIRKIRPQKAKRCADYCWRPRLVPFRFLSTFSLSVAFLPVRFLLKPTQQLKYWESKPLNEMKPLSLQRCSSYYFQVWTNFDLEKLQFLHTTINTNNSSWYLNNFFYNVLPWLKLSEYIHVSIPKIIVRLDFWILPSTFLC